MRLSPGSSLLPLLKLTKPIITLSVAFSALTGFVLYSGAFSQGWLPLYFGVMLIAAGSSAINQIQEKHYDSLMERTRLRPMPSGQIGKVSAWVFSLLLAASGAVLLWLYTSPLASALAIVTLLWYNGIYTPLKRVSPWAILPGAVVGAIPPAIGWTAAGGSILHPHISFVAFFFFMGQIPHFWLILLRYGKDYELAGFSSVSAVFSPEQIARLTFLWTSATAVSSVFLWVFGIVHYAASGVILILLSALLITTFQKWPGIKKPAFVNRAFMVMNIYFLFIMILIMVDALLR